MVVDTSDPATIAALAGMFEGAPRFTTRLVAAGPYASWDDLFERAEGIALAMPEDEQIELIDAHPRLGAPPASVSAASFREQGYNRDTEAAIAELAELNALYEDRFGFRYCVFVDGRSRPELIPEMRARLAATRDVERHRALHEVIAIARDRQARGVIVSPEGQPSP